MAAIRVICIGKTADPVYRTMIQDYIKRVQHYAKFEWVELSIKTAKNVPENKLKEREAEEVLKQISTADDVILLDEGGKTMGSVKFANWLEQKQLYSSKSLVFVVGGAFGFGSALKKRADFTLSLSAMTFTHQMVRLFFAEQLYRAFTIQRGESYHNE
jgi:23S rRNA (pseudouridine1915-N3)-methyltransferase